MKNANADSFITFLKDNRGNVLNGRVTPGHNNFSLLFAVLYPTTLHILSG